MSQKKKKDNNIYVENITLLLKVVLDKGYTLQLEKYKIATKLKKLGHSYDMIAEATGLSEKEIKDL